MQSPLLVAVIKFVMEKQVKANNQEQDRVGKKERKIPSLLADI